MERVEGAGGALGKHIDGDGKRPETAAPRVLVGADGVEEKLKPVVLLDDEGEEIDLAAAKTRTTEAQKYMQKCRRKKTRGRQPMGGSTWVFAGPPRYDSEDAWSSTEVRSWAADCTKWLKKRSGKGSRIAHCALHQDEAAPHLHVTVIVADEQGRLGWNRIRKNFGVEGKTSGVLLMSGLQDNFHAAAPAAAVAYAASLARDDLTARSDRSQFHRIQRPPAHPYPPEEPDRGRGPSGPSATATTWGRNTSAPTYPIPRSSAPALGP